MRELVDHVGANAQRLSLSMKVGDVDSTRMLLTLETGEFIRMGS